MKRYIAMTFVATLFAIFGHVSAMAQEAKVSFDATDKVAIAQGGTASVGLKFERTGGSWSDIYHTFLTDILLPEGITVASESDVTLAESLADTHTLSVHIGNGTNGLSAGVVRIGVFSNVDGWHDLPSEPTVVCTIKFTASATLVNVPGESIEVEISGPEAGVSSGGTGHFPEEVDNLVFEVTYNQEIADLIDDINGMVDELGSINSIYNPEQVERDPFVKGIINAGYANPTETIEEYIATATTATTGLLDRLQAIYYSGWQTGSTLKDEVESYILEVAGEKDTDGNYDGGYITDQYYLIDTYQAAYEELDEAFSAALAVINYHEGAEQDGATVYADAKTAYQSFYTKMTNGQYNLEQHDKFMEKLPFMLADLEAVRYEYGNISFDTDNAVSLKDYTKFIDIILDLAGETAIPTPQMPDGYASTPVATIVANNKAVVKYLLADTNSDRNITVADVGEIVDVLMGRKSADQYVADILEPALAAKKRASVKPIEERATIEAVASDGYVTTYAINLNNSSDYSAFQMDVRLDEGMQIVSRTVGERAEKLSLASRSFNEGTLTRIIATSNRNENISGFDGAIIYIDVEGEGNISVNNIMLGGAKGKSAKANALTATQGVEATGINRVSTTVAAGKTYNVSGISTESVEKGINIVRGKKFVK